MALIALFVRASSQGPVFFLQSRAGRNREAFTLYKFRTMRKDALRDSALTVYGDPRITTVGAFLRRYKLDELPQLLNVVKGDLSLVGPRPKLAHLEALDLPYRPGVTGIATLAFRNEEKILADVCECHVDSFYENCIKPRKAQLDRDYMRNATLWTDLDLLWRTACSCLLRSDRLPLDEAERLKLIAAAWPDAPSRRSAREASNCIAGGEFHGARWPEDYQGFDEAFEQE